MTNQSTTGDIRGVSHKVVTAVIAFVLAIIIFASTAFAQMVSNYTVEIKVDNNTYTITTNETEPVASKCYFEGYRQTRYKLF